MNDKNNTGPVELSIDLLNQISGGTDMPPPTPTTTIPGPGNRGTREDIGTWHYWN